MTYVKRRLWHASPRNERIEIGEDELLSRSECLVILGEPGMGKSTLLQNLAGAAGLPWCTARQFINRPDAKSLIGNKPPVIVDALDEVAARRDGDAVDLVLQKLGALDYPRFVLSCRVADWEAATSVEAIREQYLEAPLQLHLQPLERSAQLAILAAKVGNEVASTLIEHFEKYGLDFLGNPQTLELIAILPPDRPLPTGRGPLFEHAIDTLRLEHRNTRGRSELARDVALDAAGAAFAGLILSGSANIVRHASANLADGELQIAEVEELDDGNVARVINTRLFSGGNDSFTYWHRRIGEFLAAAWLGRRADTPVKRRRLLQLFHAQGLVPASLRGLHAWLARDLRLVAAVIAADPMGIIEYGDADALTADHAHAMLTALQKRARDNPRFWSWRHARARALVAPALRDEVDLVLGDKTAALGLRALLLEQLSDPALAQPFKQTLRELLLDQKEAFGIRRRAGDALANLSKEDWPKLVEALRIQGDGNAKRLAFELMHQIGCSSFPDNQIVEVILAYDGLTALPWPKQSDGGLAVRFWRFADRVPINRLDGILDTLSAFVSELLGEHAGIEEHDLIGLAHKLVLRRLEVGGVEPLRLWTWILPYPDHRSEDEKKVADWIGANDDARRDIQRNVILDDSQKPIWRKAALLSRVSSGLAPNEGDVVALLRALDPTDRGDTRWRDVLQLIPHDGQTGATARDAAKAFVAHDSQLRDWIDRLAEQRVPDWKTKQEAKARQRAAKRAVRFAEQRRDFMTKLEGIRAGEFGYVYPLAQAYLKRFQDVGDDREAHDRVAEWLGEDIAQAAHQGFEAFLTKQPAHPSATRIALTIANNRRYPASDVIVAALAERVRTRADPFTDLSAERLMAGLFEIWNSAIQDHAGLPNLRERIESELRQRGAWERTIRLYIAPQLKRRVPYVGFLSSLMHSEADAALAEGLAAEWLRGCPDLLAAAEEEMIDRLLHSLSRAELREIGDMRRGNLEDDKRRRNWDAVQVLVDFEAPSARLRETVEPELLWHIRALGGGQRLRERPQIKMLPSQLEWIVSAFRKSWPARLRPDGVTWGNENAWEASEYLFNLISRLGEDTSDEAVDAIEALLDMPHDGYTDHIRAVAAEQRQKRVERAYTPPTLREVISVLNSGPPTGAADLQAMTLEALETVQELLRGSDVDWYRGFFRENSDHKNEEHCRDEIIKMLRVVEPTLEYFPETHVADDKRVDIVVRASERLILPIEVKGQWHQKLWTAADEQLDHLYVNDWRAERGIYLVLWFGEGALFRNPLDGRLKPATPQEFREALRESSKAARANRVDIIVLDVTRPSPASAKSA